jgi:drug/metabolite transporter (DMT)-like permease
LAPGNNGLSGFSDLQTGVLAALATTACYSFSAIAGSRLSRLLGGVEANFLRILVATGLLALYAHTLGKGFSGKALPYFLLSGVIGFGIGDLALYQAYPLIGSRVTMILVHCLAAPMAALVEWIWLGTELTVYQFSCSVVILIGVGIALAPKEHLHLERRALIAGSALGIIAAIGQAFASVTSRKAYFVTAIAHQNIDGITAAYQRIWGGVFFATLGYILHRWRTKERLPPFRERLGGAWKWLALNATSGAALGVSFFQFALSKAPTGIVLPIVALTPLTIIPLSQRFENERPSPRSILGGAIAVAGVIGLRWSLK